LLAENFPPFGNKALEIHKRKKCGVIREKMIGAEFLNGYSLARYFRFSPIRLTTYQFWPEAVDDLTFGVMKARF